MIYSDKVKKAMHIACKAHMNQKDKGGYPYIHHPLHLAEQMETEEEVIVALLHDVKEDHDEVISWEEIEKEFGSKVKEALILLTHSVDVPYMDYVKELSKNPIARKVKMADLLHNMDSTRTDGKLPPKIEIYKKACDYLSKLE